MVDATFVNVPKQRNTREKKQIEEDKKSMDIKTCGK